MNKQCVNCPGAVDHSTDECPIRARFKAYMLGREHPVIGWIDDHWLRRGDDPSTYANDYVQGCWVIWQSRPGVPDGWNVYRDSTGAIYVGLASGRHPGVWLCRDGGMDERRLWSYFDEVLDAVPAAQPVTDQSQRALIRLAMNLLNLRNHVPGSDVDLCVKALADLLDGKHSPTPEPSEAWREVAEIAQAEAPAVVNQQVTTAACLWKREQDSGFYETGCGKVWHFTDGSTPEENSAYFCHHCGKSLEVQRLIAYQVGDNDIVAAYDPASAIQVLVDFAGYGQDFDESDVEPVSDKMLDATEAYDQDEGKTVTLEKTLRQELEELTEPAYLHGWE